MRMRRNKKGFELSINMLVVIILSLAMLGLGVMLITQFFHQSLDIQKRISEQEEDQINSMLNRGERVALPINIKTIPRGEVNVFGLGVLNILDNTTTFEIEIDFQNMKVFDKQGTDLLQSDTGAEINKVAIISEREEISLKPNEQGLVNIFIKVDKAAPRGTYIYPVRLKQKNGQYYGNPVKFTIVVP